MREIKFRGYDGMDWMYSVTIFFEKETDTWFMIKEGHDDWTMVGNVGQYTGLKDKNGKEIYEGDIVKDDTNKIKTILFEGGSFGCRVKKLKSFYSQETIEVFYSLYEYVLGDVEIEVIGNIYENPSLLEGESND